MPGRKGIRSYLISPTREIKEFLGTVALQQLGVGLVNIFEPIYLYGLGIPPIGIVWYYVAAYLPYLFIMPLGGRFAKRFGYEHALAVGTFFNVAYFCALAAIPHVHEALFVAPLLLGLQKTFWWPAYHADFARFSRGREVGREVGFVQTLYSLAGGVGPVIGGFVAQYLGFSALLVVAVIVLVLSVIPLFTTREEFIPTELTWREQWAFLLRPAYRRRLLGSLGFGAEFVNLVTWPLFIFVALGTTSRLGIVAGISTVVTIVVMELVSRYADRSVRASKRAFLWTNIVHAASWLARPFVRTFAPVAAADSVGYAARNLTYVPYYKAVYRDAKANHVMIEVVASEMALVIGKLLTMGAVLVVLYAGGGLPGTFFVGFAASLFFFLFK
ncbi:MAG: MFS transporter [Candidatus Andersenbacteria bacterium]